MPSAVPAAAHALVGSTLLPRLFAAEWRAAQLPLVSQGPPRASGHPFLLAGPALALLPSLPNCHRPASRLCGITSTPRECAADWLALLSLARSLRCLLFAALVTLLTSGTQQRGIVVSVEEK